MENDPPRTPPNICNFPYVLSFFFLKASLTNKPINMPLKRRHSKDIESSSGFVERIRIVADEKKMTKSSLDTWKIKNLNLIENKKWKW